MELGALRRFKELITNQSTTVERVWFSAEVLKRYVNKIGSMNVCCMITRGKQTRFQQTNLRNL